MSSRFPSLSKSFLVASAVYAVAVAGALVQIFYPVAPHDRTSTTLIVPAYK